MFLLALVLPVLVEEPESAAEDDGASGEAEDPSAECGASGGEGREDTEDFMAFGNEEQAHRSSQAAHGVMATPPRATQSGAEGAVGTESNIWGAPQVRARLRVPEQHLSGSVVLTTRNSDLLLWFFPL